jgi:hypothetical protein
LGLVFDRKAVAGCRSTYPIVGILSFENEDEEDFSFSKILQFPSKSAVFDRAAFLETPIIVNIHRVILIFMGFLPSDPLPTPFFCRKMAKICRF